MDRGYQLSMHEVEKSCERKVASRGNFRLCGNREEWGETVAARN